MKRFIAFCFFLAGISFIAKADHITGGEMFYSYLGRSGSDYQYSVTLKLFMRCNSGRRFNDPTIVSVFDRITNARVRDMAVPLSRQVNISLPNTNPCITNPPTVCYDVAYYEFVVSLPANINGYTLSSQVNYRIAGINNLGSGYSQVGATYTAEIPGNSVSEGIPANNSAHFIGTDLVVVCANNSFSYSFAASDVDGDELRYSFCNAYVSGTFGTNVPPPPPPYVAVPYGSGFNGSAPLGNNVRINPSTGLITGVAPTSGVYVVTVCVEEIRNGVVISTQRKDLQINITECSIAAASLLPEYQLCKTTTSITLSNLSTSPLIKTYNWQFANSTGSTIFTSTNPSATYNFPDTGLYYVRLYINQGEQCSDSTSSLIRVYPGLQSNFNFSGICVNKQTSFLDASQTVYGTINSMLWDFDDPTVLSDTSRVKNPVYTYPQTGPKNASLIVGTTKGCLDTLTREVLIVDKPPLNLAFKDTLICNGDTLQLRVSGNGIFSWSPVPGIINAGTATPLVHPAVTTKYTVELDDNGCRNKDSVQVRVVDFVSLSANRNISICERDSIQLGATTNGLQFQWSPASTVSNASLLNPIAAPATTTTYQLTATIGHCTATDQMTVKAIPYPLVNAGKDTTICFRSTAQLKAFTSGSSFTWSPAGTLSNAARLDPVAAPPGSTAYVLSAFDTLGCAKPAKDTVLVTVLPRIVPGAGNDTAAIVGQPLQLTASGGIRYAWFPNFNLSATNIVNPVALFNEGVEGVRYGVKVYNEAGCMDSAFITIKIFTTPPTVFVPTAFTPNNDGKNDVLRPIAAGITAIEYFRVFNRWGQLVFHTTTNGKGWDGKIGGKEQGTGSFVWEVKATDYKGISYTQKGIVTLIR